MAEEIKYDNCISVKFPNIKIGDFYIYKEKQAQFIVQVFDFGYWDGTPCFFIKEMSSFESIVKNEIIPIFSEERFFSSYDAHNTTKYKKVYCFNENQFIIAKSIISKLNKIQDKLKPKVQYMAYLVNQNETGNELDCDFHTFLKCLFFI